MTWCRYAVVLQCAFFFNKDICSVLSTSPEKSTNSDVVQLSINTCAVCCPNKTRLGLSFSFTINFRTHREKSAPLMATSSAPPFPWTDCMIDQALTCTLEVVRGGRDDPFDEDNIRQAVTTCRSRATSSSNSSLLQHATVGQLRQLLMDMRQRYVRICELADHPWTVGFSQRYHKIVMSPKDAAQHILVRYSSFSTIEHTCYPTLSFLYFHSYSFTPLGIPR